MKSKALLSLLFLVSLLGFERAQARMPDACRPLYEELQECINCGSCCDQGDYDAIVDELFDCWGMP